MLSERKNLWLRALDPSILLGAAGTVMFYAVMHQPFMEHTLLHRFTTEHPVEYVIVALFIWGLVDIALKLSSFPKEKWALQQEWLATKQGREPVANASAMLEDVLAKPQWLQETKVARRLVRALEYVEEKGSAEDFRNHLHYLADQDEDAVHGSYTLTRFIIGLTPVLGFLGTVVHFGTALGGVSFEEMAEKLPLVVSEMGEAFNTTCAALVAAITMMISLFICERTENGILRSINRFFDRELDNRFEVKDPSITPFLAAVQSANDSALGAINGTLQKQIDVWSQAIGKLYEKFDERQGQEAVAWRDALDVLQKRHEQYDTQREERLHQLLALIESRQDKFMAHIQSTLERAVALRDDFSGLLQAIESIARGEGRLVELQSVLAENLRVLRETQQIDGAMHDLTAGEQPRPYVISKRVNRNAA
jgi:biopolymer transport protein ExbB/TolQ